MALQLYYPLDGHLEDRSGNDWHLSNGTPGWTTGPINQCAQNDGTNLNIPTDALGTCFGGMEFTISLWWRQHATSTRWNDMTRYYDVNGTNRRLERGRSDDGDDDTDYWCNIGITGTGDSYIRDVNMTEVREGEWFHFVVRRTQTDIEVWINGDLHQSKSHGGTEMANPDTSSAWEMFNQNNDSDVAEFKIFDHAISEQRIKEEARCPAGHWRLTDMADHIDNVYSSESLSAWRANNGSDKDKRTDGSIPAAEYGSSDYIWLHKNETDTTNSDQWHGTHKSGVADVPAEVGDHITFSGWYRFTTSGDHKRDDLRGILYNRDESGESGWNNVGSGGITMTDDGWWHRFEFTVEVVEDPYDGYINPSWQWGYDYGPQTLELCGLQIQKKEGPSNEFTVGQDARNGFVPDITDRGGDGMAKHVSRISDTPVGRSAIEFTDDSGDIPLLAHFDSSGLYEMTSCAWVKVPSGAGNWSVLDFDRSENFMWSVDNDGTVEFNTTPASGGTHDMNSAGTVDDGTWHHVAVVYDGTDKIIYIDGAEDSRASNPHSGEPLGYGRMTRYGYIGNGSEAGGFDSDDNASGFIGGIADVRLYARALDAPDFEDIMNPSIALGDTGHLDAYEVAEYDHKGLLTNEEYAVQNSTHGILATVTPNTTDFSDWVEPDDTLGNIAVVGVAHVTDTQYYPDRFELTDVNNDEGVVFDLHTDGYNDPDNWQVGDNLVFATNPRWQSPGATDWANLDRLQLYRKSYSDDRYDTTESVTFKNFRLVKLPDPADSPYTRFEFGENGTLRCHNLIEDANDLKGTDTVAAERPTGFHLQGQAIRGRTPRLLANVTLNGQTVTATVHEDFTHDGNPDESHTVNLENGFNSYALPSLSGKRGSRVWVDLELSTTSERNSPVVHDVMVN